MEDPNFEAHLPNFMKTGLASDRPDVDIAHDLRVRFKVMEGALPKAAKILKTSNVELAAELEELADELAETHEKFVQTALWWDAWSRPSPDLPSELRQKERGSENDPNFIDNLPRFMAAGSREDRPEVDLPSELRLMKYKNMAAVKRLAATELRKSGSAGLADEMDELAIQIEESHEKFVDLAAQLRARDAARPEL
eukprot:CAMPEP_0119041352 /NCGR_PEP_ID=MMETSP1177-20130426/11577_1 /TAXON_ID=2985 /ORGANISM="Ochromonas sp, Strain CCMP1899" /LENGTH=195 /DNA_ID=CAMNT_0007007329 /DNA_START=285 /DNA_END=872 /DNA_ORIENTATION=-